MALTASADPPAGEDPRASVYLARAPLVTAATSLTIAALAGLGWTTGSALLRQVRSEWASMKPVTALGVGLLALALLAQAGGSAQHRQVGRVLAGTVAAFAAVSVGGYSMGATARVSSVIGGASMAPSAATAVVLLLIATSAAMGFRPKAARVLLVAGSLIPYVALVGYAIAVQGLYSFGPFSSMSLQTAVATELLAIGGLAAGSSPKMRRLVTGTDPGSLLVRHLVPPGLVLFPALGLAGQQGIQHGWWTPPFATALAALGGTVFTVGLVVLSAQRLSRMDRLRIAAAELAECDALTGIGNRRSLDRALGRLFRDTEEGACAALLVLDVDDFKQINDVYGHDAGDRTLRDFVACVQSNIRSTDLLVRTGGDEFAILAPLDRPGDERIVAEDLMRAISSWRTAQPPRPSASIGVALRAADMENARDLEKRADIALYEAKRAGKGRFASYSRPGEASDSACAPVEPASSAILRTTAA